MTEVKCTECKKDPYAGRGGVDSKTGKCWFCAIPRKYWTPEYWESCRPDLVRATSGD